MKTPIILAYKPLTRTGNINEAYPNAIKNSGGELKMIETKEEIDNLIQNADGILLPGGADVNPVLYNEEKKEYCGKINDKKDDFEIYLIEKAREKKIPILGICRGIQVLNVKFGGTLYQDIGKDMRNSLNHDRFDNGPRSFLAHEVSIEESSMLHKILGTDRVETNSLHHQGVKDLGQGLVATGFTSDGLVEALEMPSYPYLVAVQWHPEELTNNPIWKKLFDSFVEACMK